MTYRYCPDCDEWKDTADIDLDEQGETVCPEDGHRAVHGSLQPTIRGFPVTEAEFRRQNAWREDLGDELEAAKRQKLVA